MNILEQANKIVNERSEEKERQYGPFAESMKRAADLFNLIAPEGESITVHGMYRALIALKLSREHYAHKEDNLLDAVAYIGALNNYIENHEEIDKALLNAHIKELKKRIAEETKPDTENKNPSWCTLPESVDCKVKSKYESKYCSYCIYNIGSSARRNKNNEE